MWKLLTTLLIALSAGPALATPITVDFAFDGTYLPGHVEGKLVFSDFGNNVQAIGAYVTKSSSGGAQGTAINFVQGATTNSFSVLADGTITAANFYNFNSASFLELAINDQGVFNIFSPGYGAIANNTGGSNLTFSVDQGKFPNPAFLRSSDLAHSVLSWGVAVRLEELSD